MVRREIRRPGYPVSRLKHQRRKKRWPGLKVFNVHMGTFDYTVKVVVGPIEQAVQFFAWYHKSGQIEVNKNYRGLCVHRDGYCPVIWIPRKPRTAREHGTLAHEALHAVGHLSRWCAIEHSEQTEEFFCHALGCIINAIMEES